MFYIYFHLLVSLPYLFAQRKVTLFLELHSYKLVTLSCVLYKLLCQVFVLQKANSFSDSQEMFVISWNLKAHYRIHIEPPQFFFCPAI
jgi:hypothetical protein